MFIANGDVLTFEPPTLGKKQLLKLNNKEEAEKDPVSTMPVAQTRLEILQVHKFLQCVRSKDKAQIEKLCSNGVPHLVNYSEPEEGETGLHLAARVNDEEMVRFLLDLGAHPNVIDLKGRTAAMRAAEFGHVQTLEILATAGSDMKIKDTDGKGEEDFILSQQRRFKLMFFQVYMKI